MDGWCGTPSTFPFQGLPFLMREGKGLASGVAMDRLVLRHQILPLLYFKDLGFQSWIKWSCKCCHLSSPQSFPPQCLLPSHVCLSGAKGVCAGLSFIRWDGSADYQSPADLIGRFNHFLPCSCPGENLSSAAFLCPGKTFPAGNLPAPSNTSFGRKKNFLPKKRSRHGDRKVTFLFLSPFSFLQYY